LGLKKGGRLQPARGEWIPVKPTPRAVHKRTLCTGKRWGEMKVERRGTGLTECVHRENKKRRGGRVEKYIYSKFEKKDVQISLLKTAGELVIRPSVK